jgi:hypothetical protein
MTYNHITKLTTYRRVSTTRGTRAIATLPCGHSVSLEQHKIDTSGKVTPFVDCSTDRCSTQYDLQLVGWLV